MTDHYPMLTLAIPVRVRVSPVMLSVSHVGLPNLR